MKQKLDKLPFVLRRISGVIALVVSMLHARQAAAAVSGQVRCAFLHRSQRSQATQTKASQVYAVPPGRVHDIDQWIRWSSDSLEDFTGTSLLDWMEGVDSIADVHESQRYAVLSHGNQTDPVYNYFNKGALSQFQWPESEVYSLPSRYSAPDGLLRQDREEMMKTVVQQEVRTIPCATRQSKFGETFQLTNVTLWNVYDDERVRVGQTAIFDRDLVVSIPNNSLT